MSIEPRLSLVQSRGLVATVFALFALSALFISSKSRAGHLEDNCPEQYFYATNYHFHGANQTQKGPKQNHCEGGHSGNNSVYEQFYVYDRHDEVDGDNGQDEIHLAGDSDKGWGGEHRDFGFGGAVDDQFLGGNGNDWFEDNGPDGIDHDSMCGGYGSDDANINDGDESDSYYGGPAQVTYPSRKILEIRTMRMDIT